MLGTEMKRWREAIEGMQYFAPAILEHEIYRPVGHEITAIDTWLFDAVPLIAKWTIEEINPVTTCYPNTVPPIQWSRLLRILPASGARMTTFPVLLGRAFPQLVS